MLLNFLPLHNKGFLPSIFQYILLTFPKTHRQSQQVPSRSPCPPLPGHKASAHGLGFVSAALHSSTRTRLVT